MAALMFAFLVATVSLVAQGVQAPVGGRGAQPGLEPRIVTFEARPTTVRAGESVLQIWQTENPAGVSIAPDVGAVTARGSKSITPASTTTYTLSMRNGPSKTVTITVTPAGPSTSGPPRAPDTARTAIGGHPDLTGVYGSAGLPRAPHRRR
jgi:hypothetical protein